MAESDRRHRVQHHEPNTLSGGVAIGALAVDDLTLVSPQKIGSHLSGITGKRARAHAHPRPRHAGDVGALSIRVGFRHLGMLQGRRPARRAPPETRTRGADRLAAGDQHDQDRE